MAHSTTVFVCDEPGCGRQFNRKYTLLEHVKSHTGERPHVCPVRTCGKRFSTSGNLSRHKRLHGYIEPLACPVEGCICAFPSIGKLEKHMKFHYGTAVKVCSVAGCGKTFSTTGNLNRHLKNHHGQAPSEGSTPRAGDSKQNVGSPTSAEQWETGTDVQPEGFWAASCFSPLAPPTGLNAFENAWNPELLDALVCFLDEGATANV